MTFSATEEMCREMGCWSYALVHEPDPVEMADVRRLSGHRHLRNRIGDVAKRLMDAFDEPRLLMGGAAAAGDPLPGLPMLYRLLRCGDLRLDQAVLAMCRLPAPAFTILMSLEPAIVATTGFLILNQALSTLDATAIALAVVASMSAVRPKPPSGAQPVVKEAGAGRN